MREIICTHKMDGEEVTIHLISWEKSLMKLFTSCLLVGFSEACKNRRQYKTVINVCGTDTTFIWYLERSAVQPQS